MAFLGQSYNAAELPEGTGNFEPIPAGWYNVTIANAELTDTKSGTGQYIKLRLDIMGPTHQGRVLFSNLNIRNANPKAEEIGHQQLGDVMRAIGLAVVEDTDQLLGGNLSVKVALKDDPQYGPGNEVKAYKAIDGAASPAPAAQSAAPAAGATSKPPWAK